jgi:hypothetical protein
VARGSTRSQTWRNTPSFTQVSWRSSACRKHPEANITYLPWYPSLSEW